MGHITSNLYTGLLTLLTISLTLFYVYLKSKFNYWKKRSVPYDEPNLIFGNFYDVFTFKQHITSFLHKQYQKTNDKVFGLYIFQRPFLLLRDPELIKHVLVKDFNNFIPRTNSESNDTLGSNSLFGLKNAHHWRFIRSKMSSFFSSGKMRNMFGLLDNIGDQLTEYIKGHLNETIDIKEVSQKYTVDVIVSAAYGIEANSFTNDKALFSSIGKSIFTYSLLRSIELFSFFFAPLLVKIFNFKFFGDKATQFFRNVFWTAINERELNNIKRPDLIEALIVLKNNARLEDNSVSDTESNGIKLDKDRIEFQGDILVAQAAIFFIAGFETSSLTMSFTLYFLSHNPEIQIKVRKEIQTVIARNDGQFTYESLQDMKFLDACVKETLRMHPTLGFLDREATHEYTFPGTNLTIDKGTAIVISLEGLHRDPQYFENPNVYSPERFLDENKHNIVPFTYMPFGEGPRNCLGARFGKISTKIGLVHILKDYEIETNKNCEPVEIDRRAVFLSPKGGINLKFRPGTVYV